ncbi:MAG: hypothetical protein AB1758_10575, partial [Candidatus Eremiobacterota bacterium]
RAGEGMMCFVSVSGGQSAPDVLAESLSRRYHLNPQVASLMLGIHEELISGGCLHASVSPAALCQWAQSLQREQMAGPLGYPQFVRAALDVYGPLFQGSQTELRGLLALRLQPLALEA